MNVIHTTKDAGCQLGTERVPNAVLGLCGGRCIAIGTGCGTGDSGWSVDGDALLAVDGLAWCQILGNQEILLAAGDEDTGMSVGLDDNLLASL